MQPISTQSLASPPLLGDPEKSSYKVPLCLWSHPSAHRGRVWGAKQSWGVPGDRLRAAL